VSKLSENEKCVKAVADFLIKQGSWSVGEHGESFMGHVKRKARAEATEILDVVDRALNEPTTPESSDTSSEGT
jgi:dTDP-4-dehydrorhamnose reductase